MAAFLLKYMYNIMSQKEYKYKVNIQSYVMYGSAGLLALFYSSLSRGIVSRIYLFVIYIECTTIHNARFQVPL